MKIAVIFRQPSYVNKQNKSDYSLHSGGEYGFGDVV